MAREMPARPPASVVTQRLIGRATSWRKTRRTASTTSVGPIPRRRDDAPSTSPTNSTKRPTSSAGVGTRAPKLIGQAIEAVGILRDRPQVIRAVAQQRAGDGV